MKILFLRHAQQTIFEGKEVLSEEGKEHLFRTLEYLQNSGTVPTSVYTSPLPRAVETAESVGKKFHVAVKVEEALGDFFREERIQEILESKKSILPCFVGHAPTLVNFVRKLVAEAPSLGRASALLVREEKGQYFLESYISCDGITQFS